MATYDALRERALSDPKVRAEYERLNRAAFASLDAMLAARRAAGMPLADIAEGTEPNAPAVE
ncbi:DNA-binding protein [Burkholderia catarinensis]|uniref:DNA-binding protein n=1 Tax=Burkholderia catarinensis TaxID=1108140 RepID=UPI00091CEC7A|nr:DNA-binding protein [Burkholderia catarinensis]